MLVLLWGCEEFNPVCQPGQAPKRIDVCGERTGDGGWLVDVPRRIFVCVDMIPCECDREGNCDGKVSDRPIH